MKRPSTCVLLALLISVLTGGVSVRLFADVTASTSPSDDDADGGSAPQGDQDSFCANEDLFLRAPLRPLAAAPRFVRLYLMAAGAPPPAPVSAPVRRSTISGPLRC